MLHNCNHIWDSVHLFCQKTLIEYYYDWLTCTIIKDKGLICKGTVQPSKFCERYEIEILYLPGIRPDVFIKSPEIEYHDDIHMYSDKSLCLHYPKDMPWGKHIMMANTTIPWISEWIVFYELWKETGKWEAPEVKHRRILRSAA